MLAVNELEILRKTTQNTPPPIELKSAITVDLKKTLKDFALFVTIIRFSLIDRHRFNGQL